MKNWLPKCAIKVLLLWLADLLMMMLTIALSNVLHIAAAGLFENEAALPFIGAAFSAVGLAGFLFYGFRIVRYQRKTLESFTDVQFAGVETALLAFMLLPLAVVGTLTGVRLFVGFSGNLYAPFLALSELGLPVFVSVLFSLAVYFTVVFFAARATRRLPLKTEDMPPEETSSEEEPPKSDS